MDNGYSLADLTAAAGGNGWGNSSWVIIILFALIFGWGGNGFGGNAPRAASTDDVQRGFDNQNLQAQTRDILAAVNSGTAQTMAASSTNAANAITAIKDGNAALIREFGTVETALTALSGKEQECCCSILRAVDGVNYNSALNTAAINATTTAQTQKILDAIAGNRMADMQNQINQLQLQAAMSGVVRYPSATTYSAGYYAPYYTSGCNCANNI